LDYEEERNAHLQRVGKRPSVSGEEKELFRFRLGFGKKKKLEEGEGRKGGEVVRRERVNPEP